MDFSTLGLKLFRRETRLTYLVVDRTTREGLAIDSHPGLLDDLRDRIGERGIKLRYCIDTQSWGDGGAATLASQFGAQELAFSPSTPRKIQLGSFPFELIDAPGPSP